MGKRRDTSEADYRLYARPPEGGGGDWVELVDDAGIGAGAEAAVGMPAALPAASGTDGSGVVAADGPVAEPLAGAAAGTDPGPRLNPYFCAAWALVALMLAGGVVWLADLVSPETYDLGGATATAYSRVAANFMMTGMFLLPTGLAGSVALLAVHGAFFRRFRGTVGTGR